MKGQQHNVRIAIKGFIFVTILLYCFDCYARDKKYSSNKHQLSFIVDSVTFTMTKVKGGTFIMGATEEQGKDVNNCEKPTHRVTLSDYYIGTTEVTQALWETVMNDGSKNARHPNLIYGNGADYPIYDVEWSDVARFLRKLNEKTGLHFRLPTEAEWEFAARGGNKSKHYKYAGGNDLDEVAWYWGNSGDKKVSCSPGNYDTLKLNHNKIHPVAQKHPNELGLYDMSGNVQEWCMDNFDKDYYKRSPENNPKFIASYAPYHVIRGGHWRWVSDGCRISFRSRPHTREYTGFRLALCLNDTEDAIKDELDDYISPKIQTDTFVVGGIAFTMEKLKGGTYDMGSREKSHEVKLSDYYIGTTEVTQALWKAVMGNTLLDVAQKLGKQTNGVGDELPMYYVSWNDCQQFIKQLNKKTGKQFRLPTEAEWKCAASGMETREVAKKDLDEIDTDAMAWFSYNSGQYVHAVGTKKPNELGLYDMYGNVSEWCSDWYDENYYSYSCFVNPKGAANGTARVVCGGGWNSPGYEDPRIKRYSNIPDAYSDCIGFRLALDVELSENDNFGNSIYENVYQPRKCISEKEIPDLVPKEYAFGGYWLIDDFDQDGLTDYMVLVQDTNSSRFEHEFYYDDNLLERDSFINRNPQGYLLVMNRGDYFEVTSYNYECFPSDNEDGGVYFAPELEISFYNSRLYIEYGHGRYGSWGYEFRYCDGDFELMNEYRDESASWIAETLTYYSINYENGIIKETDLVNEDDFAGEEENYPDPIYDVTVLYYFEVNENSEFNKLSEQFWW